MKTVNDVLKAYPPVSKIGTDYRTGAPKLQPMAAIAYKIPMSQLETVQKIFRNEKVKVNYFWRGPRIHRLGELGPEQSWYYQGELITKAFPRTRHNCQSNCMKKDAVYFSVYLK